MNLFLDLNVVEFARMRTLAWTVARRLVGVAILVAGTAIFASDVSAFASVGQASVQQSPK